ncbi:MAG: hypothetical protein WBL02_06300 [Methanomethylovorans sp.]
MVLSLISAVIATVPPEMVSPSAGNMDVISGAVRSIMNVVPVICNFL